MGGNDNTSEPNADQPTTGRVSRRRALQLGGLAVAGGTVAATVPWALRRRDQQADAQAQDGRVATRPNLLVIFADDMRWDELPYMPNLNRLLEQGTHFSRLRQPTPMCSPARATFLRGQNPTGSNGHGLLSQATFGDLQHESLALWLRDADYHNGLLGKYFLPIGADRPAPGWHWWRAALDPEAYNYRIATNARVIHPRPHQDDWFLATAQEFVAEATEPWFLWYCANSPHTPLHPSPQNTGRHADVDWPYEPQPLADHPSWIRRRPEPATQEISDMQDYQRLRLDELADLDDFIGTMVEVLDRQGQLEDTVIMFYSDNGNSLLDHRTRVLGKHMPYDWAMLTPLTVVGGGFPAGVTVDVPCTAPDVTATVTALAGATATVPQHGIDLRDVVADPGAFADRATLGGMGGRLPAAEGRLPCSLVCTSTHKLVRYNPPPGGFADPTDDFELYDLVDDPLELHNLAHQPEHRPLRDELEQRLDALHNGEA
ncbi:MAG: sulfatase-like hydrolase/transferase [Acidimicrobiia bacterium]|nr:sulfatase-like hydrolase/transferase [Acidimicrobiia bacterium]